MWKVLTQYVLMRFCRDTGNLLVVATGAEEGAGKTIDNWGLLIWALMEK